MAETTRLIFSALIEKYPEEYEFHQIGLFHCYAVTEPLWPIYSTKTLQLCDGKVGFVGNDVYGQLTFGEIVEKIKPDIVFAFNDPQNLIYLCSLPGERNYKLILYVSVDGFPLPPDYGPMLARADLVVTMSEFSLRVLLAAYHQVPKSKTDFMYSPADTVRFQPINDLDKSSLRKDLFPDWMPSDAFVLGWIGRNQWRKQVWVPYKVIHYLRRGAYFVCERCCKVTLYDWDPISQHHLNVAGEALESPPSFTFDICLYCGSSEIVTAKPLLDIVLWLHMPDDDPRTTWPLPLIEQQFGIRKECDVHYTENCKFKAALAPADMPTLYNLWDCFLYLSGGEGFGIPAWEAMCASLPVVHTNYSSHSEFLRKANGGIPIGGLLQPEAKTCIWRMVADVSQAIEAIRKLYFERDLGKTLGGNGRRFVQHYTLTSQATKWHRIFQLQRGASLST